MGFSQTKNIGKPGAVASYFKALFEFDRTVSAAGSSYRTIFTRSSWSHTDQMAAAAEKGNNILSEWIGSIGATGSTATAAMNIRVTWSLSNGSSEEQQIFESTMTGTPSDNIFICTPRNGTGSAMFPIWKNNIDFPKTIERVEMILGFTGSSCGDGSHRLKLLV